MGALDELVTPSTAEILAMKSEAIGELAKQDLTRSQLLDVLAESPGRPTVSIPSGTPDEHLGADDARIVASRRRNAAIAAVHQLEQDRVIASAPVGLPLVAGTLVVGNDGYSTTSRNVTIANPIGMRTGGPRSDEVFLQLVSAARGWTSSDHEAFALSGFQGRASYRLVTANGELVLVEALDAFRVGRYLSSAFMLGALSETVWMAAAQLCAPNDPMVAKETAKTMPSADRVMTTVLDYLATKGTDYLRRQLEPWIRSTLAVRNVIGHANILQNRTGSFTETSTAVRLIDTYRNLEDLDTALVAKGV